MTSGHPGVEGGLQIFVKPERRGSSMPSPVMTKSIKKAKRRGIRPTSGPRTVKWKRA